METTAAEEHSENAAAESAATKVWADSNSHLVSGYSGLNHHEGNNETSYFRDSLCFHLRMLAYRSTSFLAGPTLQLQIIAVFRCRICAFII
jgi:hypothetical protein